MRNVLAITVALTVAAIVLMPALGYTNQAAGNQSYSIKSGEKVSYSFSTGIVAHNLTADMMKDKYSFKSSGVESTKVAYSFKEGDAQPYSLKTEKQDAKEAITLGGNTKSSLEVGTENVMEEKETAPVEEPTEGAATTETTEAPAAADNTANVTPVETAPAAKFTIEGMVFNDSNANSTLDADEAGLGNWTVNLEQAGAVVKTAVTTADGKFSFADVDAGEYVVSEVLADGYSIISPADGKVAVTITDASKTDLAFANQLIPAVVETPAPVAAENATVVADANTTAVVDINNTTNTTPA